MTTYVTSGRGVGARLVVICALVLTTAVATPRAADATLVAGAFNGTIQYALPGTYDCYWCVGTLSGTIVGLPSIESASAVFTYTFDLCGVIESAFGAWTDDSHPRLDYYMTRAYGSVYTIQLHSYGGIVGVAELVPDPVDMALMCAGLQTTIEVTGTVTIT